MTDPLDATHTESVLARMAIRDHVAAYRSMFILGWQPRPCPPRPPRRWSTR